MDIADASRRLGLKIVGPGDAVFSLPPMIRFSGTPNLLPPPEKDPRMPVPFFNLLINGSWKAAELAAATMGYGAMQKAVLIHATAAESMDVAGQLLAPTTNPPEQDGAIREAFVGLGLEVFETDDRGWYFPDWVGNDPLAHGRSVIAGVSKLGAGPEFISLVPGRICILLESEYPRVFMEHFPELGGRPPGPAEEQRQEFRKGNGL